MAWQKEPWSWFTSWRTRIYFKWLVGFKLPKLDNSCSRFHLCHGPLCGCTIDAKVVPFGARVCLLYAHKKTRNMILIYIFILQFCDTLLNTLMTYIFFYWPRWPFIFIDVCRLTETDWAFLMLVSVCRPASSTTVAPAGTGSTPWTFWATTGP